jgi:phenylacetate-CoA ligase
MAPLSLTRDAFVARRQGPAAIERRGRARLAELVEFVRDRSPFFRALYRGLPDGVADAAALPATDKATMLDRFDDWATDREVTWERAWAFASDPAQIGKPFLGRHLLVTSSGTTGLLSMLVIDDGARAVANALRLRALRGWLGAPEVARILRLRGRTAIVCATHGHFTASGLARSGGMRAGTTSLFSTSTPTPELVAQINRMRPAILSGYGSMIGLLASEQQAGRLRIAPALVASSAEGLSPSESDRVETAFGCKLRGTYAAAECHFIAHSCEQGWMHVNSDWALLEPVDEERRPVGPGVPSHGVLLTNLANRVQPIIRYALDDSVLARPDPCPCGSPFPAVQVQGRTADMIELGEAGESVGIPPMPLAMTIGDVAAISRYQIVQTGPATLRVRLQVADGVDADRTWAGVHAALTGFLTDRGAGSVEVERGNEEPQPTAGGKLRKVVPLDQGSSIADRRRG